jgi:tetratricopeptide (TPR) repeat protein
MTQTLIERIAAEDHLREAELECLKALRGSPGADWFVESGEEVNVDLAAAARGRQERRLLESGSELLQRQEPLAAGHLQLALRIYVAAEGAAKPMTFACAHLLALAWRVSGELEDAAALLDELLRTRLDLEGFSEAALTLANDLIVMLLDLDRLDAAEDLIGVAVERSVELLGPDAEQTLTLRSNLADVLRLQGAMTRSVAVEVDVLERRRTVLGDRHPETLTSMNNLAASYLALGRVAEARRLQEEVLRVRREILPDHPDTVSAMGNLAVTLYRAGEWPEALRLERQVLEARIRRHGSDHPDTLTAQNNLAGTLRDLGDFGEAQRLLEDALSRRRRLLPGHPETVMAQTNLADLLCKTGDLKRARALAEEVLAVLAAQGRAEDAAGLNALGSLASILEAQGMVHEARPAQERLVAGRRRLLGLDHYDTLLAQNDLAVLLEKSGSGREARPLYEDVRVRQERLFGVAHPDSMATRLNLAELLFGQGEAAAAEADALHVARLLVQRPVLYGDDYQLAARTFALLNRLEGSEPLEALFAALSRAMCIGMELRPRDSASRSWPHFYAFHETWQDFCLRSGSDALPAAILATQGLEAGATALAGLVQETGESPPSGREALVAARQALVEIRMSLEQIEIMLRDLDRELGAAEPGTVGSLSRQRDELQQAREALLHQERPALERYEEAKERFAATEPRVAAGLVSLRVTITDLQQALDGSDLLMLLWRKRDGTCSAYVLSRDTRAALSLPQLPGWLASVEGYERQYSQLARGLRTYEGESRGPEAGAHIPLEEIRAGCTQSFWEPLRAHLAGKGRALIVTGAGLHASPLELGNPGIEARYYLGLPAYRRLRGQVPASNDPMAVKDVEIVVDPAWLGRHAIPFVEAEAHLIERLVQGSARLEADTWLAGLGAAAQGARRRVAIACHGRQVGAGGDRYPVLMIDSRRGTKLAPAALHGLAWQLEEFYCSACVGGLVSDTSGGDALGIVSALQLHGVGAVVASSASLPDFYMPILSALYWLWRRGGVPAHTALARAKDAFGSGDWPLEVVEPIRAAYVRQVLAVLEGVALNAQGLPDEDALALCATIGGWLWPQSLTGTGYPDHRVRDHADHARFSAAFCGDRAIRELVAQEVAGNLVGLRHAYPRPVIEHLSAFLTCYG